MSIFFYAKVIVISNVARDRHVMTHFWPPSVAVAVETALYCNSNHPVSCDAGYCRHPDSNISRLRSVETTKYYSVWQPANDN